MQDKKPDLSFFHVFDALYYPTNNNDDLGKLDAKADIGIFVGYAPTKKSFRIYNKRTQKIIETIHVTFVELTTMASEQFSSGPELYSMTPVTSSSGLVPNHVSQQPCIPPLRDDWDRLFQPMFDEYFNPPSIVVSLVQEAAAPRVVVLADSPVSTSIDQDAPSTSIPSTQEHENSPNISQGFEELPKTPIFHDDPLYESFHEDSTSQGSSSNVRHTHTPFEHLGRWTKDHPIANVIEPKNFKQAMTEPSWIDAMKEEIHEFERLQVWELVSCEIDPTLFTWQAGNDLLLVQIYVDDIIFASINTAMCNDFANQMTTKFKMSMMGQMSFFLGLQISQSPRGIFINQSKYASEIVKKYGMLSSNSIDTHMVEKSKLDEDLQGKPVDATLYRRMIGSLMYLTSSRETLFMQSAYVPGIRIPIPLYCDNKSAIALCCNNVQHSRAKHIDVRYHFIKEQRKIQFPDREARNEKHVFGNAKTSDRGRRRVKVVTRGLVFLEIFSDFLAFNRLPIVSVLYDDVFLLVSSVSISSLNLVFLYVNKPSLILNLVPKEEILSFTHCGNKSILRVLRIILVILPEHPSETIVFHNEDGNPARANIKQALGYRKDGDGDGNSQPHKGVKASANSDVKYSFTSAQDGEPLQDDVRLCLGNDLKKAQDHSQRHV
ncbi:retrovirus-related pol polyprotein from transposon TNT 1-94 [Tanacetum coccineum]